MCVCVCVCVCANARASVRGFSGLQEDIKLPHYLQLSIRCGDGRLIDKTDTSFSSIDPPLLPQSLHPIDRRGWLYMVAFSWKVFIRYGEGESVKEEISWCAFCCAYPTQFTILVALDERCERPKIFM